MRAEGGVDEVYQYCSQMGELDWFMANKPNLNSEQEHLLGIFYEMSYERRKECGIARREVYEYCENLHAPMPKDLMFSLIRDLDVFYLKTTAEAQRKEMEKQKNG